jgi:hypothetical protein
MDVTRNFSHKTGATGWYNKAKCISFCVLFRGLSIPLSQPMRSWKHIDRFYILCFYSDLSFSYTTFRDINTTVSTCVGYRNISTNARYLL